MKKLPLVNICQGTRSDVRFSHGNTLPLTQVPFGMVAFAPQTRAIGSWFYQPDAHSMEGIRITRQPSPWIRDYGAMLMLPTEGEPKDRYDCAYSAFRPDQAILKPDYLKVDFQRYHSTMELTPAERGAVIRLNFRGKLKPYLSVYGIDGVSGYQIDRDNDVIYLFNTGKNPCDCSLNFRAYYAFRFPKGAVDYDKTVVHGKCPSNEAVLHIAFAQNSVEFKLGTSYIDNGYAVHVIDSQIKGNFEETHAAAEANWEEKLSRIEIEAADDRQLRTFYSCMYRIFLYPHKAYELDWEDKTVHYSPFDGLKRPGVRYTDNGFWDTYRTVYPLFALIARDEYAEMLEGFVNDYRDCGWLPRWPSLGENGCMPSTLIDAVIADAAMKNIVSREVLETALEGMLKHANTDAPDSRFGRNGCTAYVKLGYVPNDVAKESVNLTLDAAYGDFCIAQVASVLGKTEIEAKYRERALNYQNLFDAETGFMRGKDSNGNRKDNFSCYSWGGEYTEGSAWQSSFAVPHDIEGLAALYGGKDKLLAKLDDLFAAPPFFEVGGYGNEIHEMTEMAAVDFGQCAISNQPSFHIPWLYAYLGKPEKTYYWVKRMCDEVFDDSPDGFPGDEDNGTMAAWYVFSCLGFYPLCPGKNEYVYSEKLVRSATVLGKTI